MSTELSTSDLNELLNEWSRVKSELSKLNNREERIKNLLNKVLDKKEETKIRGDDYEVVKRVMSRDQLSKKDVPEEIWLKYKKKLTYSALYLKKL